MIRRIDHRSMRFRLILTIGLILLVFQVISVVWLWHESKEQIQFLVEAHLQKRNMDSSVEREVREAVASLAVPSLVMIALTLLLCFQAVKWITRPLYRLQRELESRSEENLDPVACHSQVHEIEAVTQAINQLVTRLNSSLERERLFTADVAHELRTPLAGLRLHLELIERHSDVKVQPLVQRLDQMTHSVSQLLNLARAGQSFTSGTYQNVGLIEDVILPMEVELSIMLEAHHQTLLLDLPEEQFVRGDATLLKMLLRNLVENAHRYSPDNSTITVHLLASPQPMMVVEDQGPGIDESKSGELSKAFIRMDSRYGGIGLGLSIVSRIVQLHRFQFFLENRRDQSGCRAVVKF